MGNKWSSLCFYCTFYRICDQLRRRFLYTYRAVYPAYDLVFSLSSLCTVASLPCSPSTPSRTNQRYFQGSMNATPYIKALQRSIPQSNHFHQITYTHNRTQQNDTVLPTSLRHASPIPRWPHSCSHSQSDSPNVSTPSRTAPANRSRGSRVT